MHTRHFVRHHLQLQISHSGMRGTSREDDEKYSEVQWDTPLHGLLPEDFVMSTPELNKKITIVDVLSHKTGMAL
jgi:hypothetical protein